MILFTVPETKFNSESRHTLIFTMVTLTQTIPIHRSAVERSAKSYKNTEWDT